MATIVTASSKGGAGKTTTCVILATTLARLLEKNNGHVTLIDADPNQPISKWAKLRQLSANLKIVSDVTEDTITDAIDDAEKTSSFVIVDLEGTASMTVSYAIGRADLVIIPTQGSQLDARETAKAINLINRQEKAFLRTIPHAVLLTRTSAAIKPKTLSHICAELERHGVPLFTVQMIEREAYRAVFSFGGGVADLDPSEVSNTSSAIENATALAGEVVSKLREIMNDNPQTEKVA